MAPARPGAKNKWMLKADNGFGMKTGYPRLSWFNLQVTYLHDKSGSQQQQGLIQDDLYKW